MLLLFSLHQMALGLFRMMGAIARDMTIANTFGSAALLAIFLLGGFIVPKGECLYICYIYGIMLDIDLRRVSIFLYLMI
jgi:hypothetical protein